MQSIDVGESGTPLLDETIGANFERTVERFADREALVEVASGRRWTYAELNQDVDALAVGLRRSGIAKATESGCGHPTAPSGRGAARDREDRRNPRKRQPGYRTRYLKRADPVGVRLLVSAPELGPATTARWSRTCSPSAPLWRTSSSSATSGEALLKAGRDERLADHLDRSSPPTTRSTSSTRAARRASRRARR